MQQQITNHPPTPQKMYSKEELKTLKKEFWEGFGLFCSNHPALGKRKFMLYNTKMRGVELKFDANRQGAYVILELNDKDEARRLEKYERLEQYKTVMESEFSEGLVWNFAFRLDTGNEVCRIYTRKTGIDILQKHQWNDFYHFMVDEMLKLERAFREVKEIIP